MEEWISYLIVHLNEKAHEWQNASFDIIMSREEGSGCKNVKLTQDVCEKSYGMDEKPWFKQERNILALSSFVYVWKRGHSCTIRVLFLKRETLFSTSLSYHFLFSSQKIYAWVLTLKVQLHVPLMIWGIWLSIKTGVKSSFSYFGPYYSWGITWWLEEREYANISIVACE